MQGRTPFDYAIIRLVPKVERQEFLNVGVILYCRAQQFLDMRYILDNSRLNAFSSYDTAEAESYLRAFRLICLGKADGGPIAFLAPAERFRWLTAARSTIIQTSPVHPGLCTDAKNTLEKIYQDFVL
jgi:hypothetical protein